VSHALRSAAVHEAGHAVVALGLGFQIRSITIVPDEARRIAGLVVFEVPSADDGNVVTKSIAPEVLARTRQAEAIIVAAGEVAVRLAGFDACGLAHDDCEDDRLSKDVWDLVGVPPWRWRHLARAAAERYLGEQWYAVQLLTNELLLAGTLTGARAKLLAGDLPLPDMRNLSGALDFWSRRDCR